MDRQTDLEHAALARMDFVPVRTAAPATIQRTHVEAADALGI